MFNFVKILCVLMAFGSHAYAQPHWPNDSLELPLYAKTDQIIHHQGYTLSYNEKYEQANWVAYVLTEAETIKSFERTNRFIEDPKVKTGSASEDDYEKSGYDRGHLAPAADMGWSEQTMSESFYFSNMSPQVPAFNRGIWKKLEEQVRHWAVEDHRIYIVTGPVFSDHMTTIGANHVAVPLYYYKVILAYHPPQIKAIGFILPNEASSTSLQDFAVSVDSVEKITHLDFFPRLQDSIEMVAESSVCTECWSWNHAVRSGSHHVSSGTATEKSAAVQCHGITQKGNRCKKMTKDPSGFCNLHQDQH